MSASNGHDHEFYQLGEKPISDFTPKEIAEIRRIARELLKIGMFKNDQFRITLEAYHRFILIRSSISDMDEDMRDKTRVLQ